MREIKSIKKRVKALVLFSGGLDSILAIEALRRQGVEVTAVTFKSYFFGVEQAKKSAKNLEFPLKVIDISEEHLDIVKHPFYGRGSGMNPCIDCHALMLEKAKEIMDAEGYHFIATGEVLGERPMSQNKKAMGLVKKKSGLNGYLLRPLSAKLLEETIPEKKGWVKRKELFDIQGRTRKKQIELAKKWGIKNFPTPGGGCILCEKEFAKKLEGLFKIMPSAGENDIELLKVGRHFWAGGTKIIVGRNHKENLKIKELAQKEDVIVELKEIPSPAILLRNYAEGGVSEKVLERARVLVEKYANKLGNKKAEFSIIKKHD